MGLRDKYKIAPKPLRVRLMDDIYWAFVPHLAMRHVVPREPTAPEPAQLNEEEERMWALHTKIQKLAQKYLKEALLEV